MDQQQRAVWIGGFLGGAFLGALVLSLNTPPAAAPRAPPSVSAGTPDPVHPVPQLMRESVPPKASGMPTFDELADEVARSQGGKISLAQMLAIARITGGGMPAAPYGSALPEPRRTIPRPSLSPDMFMGDVGRAGEPPRPAWNDGTSRHGYSGVDLYEEEPSASSMSADRLNARNGRPMISTGDGFTSGRDYHAPAGPDGAVNARTGEYTPLVNGM